MMYTAHNIAVGKAPAMSGPQVYKQYGLPRMSALRATLRREITLIRRTSFIYIFRTFQVRLPSLACYPACDHLAGQQCPGCSPAT